MSEPQAPPPDFVQLAEQVHQVVGAPVTVLVFASADFADKHMQVASSLSVPDLRAGLPTLLRQLADEVEAQSPEYVDHTQGPGLTVVREADGAARQG